MSIYKKLKENVEWQMDELMLIELGSDKHTVVTDNIVKLCDRSIEMEKLDQNFEIKSKELEMKSKELELKAEELNQEKENNKWKNLIGIAGIVVPTCVSVWGIIKSLKFEQDGSVTTIVGRGLVNKLIPKK